MTKPRKPRPIKHAQVWQALDHPYPTIDLNSSVDMDYKEARKLAAWLLKAADYLEAQDKK